MKEYVIYKWNDIEILSRWGFLCPACNEWNEVEDDPEYEESYFCEHCRNEIKIKDQN